MPPISATIITLNEAKNIARAIRSVAGAEEILVVDAGSTDETQRLARDLGARVLEHPWEGFAAQKNFAVRQARHDWILSLDADEELDADAQAAIRLWKGCQPAASAYRFARRARYLGRWILHSGWYPDWKIRLFDRRKGQWQGAYVHESVVVTGPVERLPGEILHYTCDSLAQHRERIEFYTGLAAQEMLERGDRANLLQKIFTPPWVFMLTYFLRLGILDGYQGFLIAWMAAAYVRKKYAKSAKLRARTGNKQSARSRG